MPRALVPLRVCKGRPKEKFNKNAQEQFVCTAAGCGSIETIGRTSDERVFAKRTCGKHFAQMTAEGLNKSKSLLGCHLCVGHKGRGAQQKASKYELCAEKRIRDVFPDSKIITQSRTLEGFNGGMDFSIRWEDTRGRDFTMDVEVDGEQQFVKPYEANKGGRQRTVDEEKDRRVIEQQRRLVRLHFEDIRRWGANLSYAKLIAERNPKRTFIVYSLSYRKDHIMKD